MKIAPQSTLYTFTLTHMYMHALSSSHTYTHYLQIWRWSTWAPFETLWGFCCCSGTYWPDEYNQRAMVSVHGCVRSYSHIVRWSTDTHGHMIYTHTWSHDPHTHGHMIYTHMVTWSTHTWSHDLHTYGHMTHTHMVTWSTRACCSDCTIVWQLELSTAAWVLKSWFRGTVCWWPISPPPCTPALNPWSTVARTMNSL